LQIADIILDRQRALEKLNSVNEVNSRSSNIFETTIKSYEEQLNEANSKFGSLKTEYDNYKIKVQHVFKKQKEQSDTNASTANSNEIQAYVNEIDQLKVLIKKLTERSEEYDEKILILEKENELIQEEFSKSLERNTKLLSELKEKETEWKLK
jgi:hypothetical protein